jgi:hypothetical protein
MTPPRKGKDPSSIIDEQFLGRQISRLVSLQILMPQLGSALCVAERRMKVPRMIRNTVMTTPLAFDQITVSSFLGITMMN